MGMIDRCTNPAVSKRVLFILHASTITTGLFGLGSAAPSSRATCIAGPAIGDLGAGPWYDCKLFGDMLKAKSVHVSNALSQQAESRTRDEVVRVLRKHFLHSAPAMNILYFSGHGLPGADHDGTRGALMVGSCPDLSKLRLSKLKSLTTRKRCDLVGQHRGRRRTYIDALAREYVLTLDDMLNVWEESRAARRGAKLLIIADSCYSGKLVARLKAKPMSVQAGLNVGIQSAGNARQTVGQGHKDYIFNHGGQAFDYSGCLTAFLTAKQDLDTRVRWSHVPQHPQFYCTWDPAASEMTSVDLDLGGGQTLRTYSQPDRR